MKFVPLDAAKRFPALLSGEVDMLASNSTWTLARGANGAGESYDRNLGDGSPLKIARSLNALWTKAGILEAPPIR